MRDASVCCLENNKQYAPQSQMMTFSEKLRNMPEAGWKHKKMENKTNYTIKES